MFVRLEHGWTLPPGQFNRDNFMLELAGCLRRRKALLGAQCPPIHAPRLPAHLRTTAAGDPAKRARGGSSLNSGQSRLGPVRKLSNRLLIELGMGLQPSVHTIYCGGDRYRTYP
jgi:hypothetical protein